MSLYVVHVITTTNRGGAENQLLLLAHEQIKLGLKVFVVDLKGRAELDSDFSSSGVTVIHDILNRSLLTQVIGLRKILQSLPSSTVVHAHLPQAELVCSLAKRKSNSLIITRHFGGKFKPSAPTILSSFLGNLASCRATKVIAISESVKNVLLKNKEVFRPSNVQVIYYGFDRERFRDRVKEIKSGDVVFPLSLGTVSRLSPEKNVDLIIRAFTQLRSELPLSNLKITGVGPLERKLKNLCVELGVENQVEFLGSSREIPEFINKLDVFILASSFEGFGMVLLEAMAVGKRIVASRNSAIEELLGGTQGGQLFDTGDLKSLIKSIQKVLTIDYEIISMAQVNRLQDFKIEKTALQILNLYLDSSSPT